MKKEDLKTVFRVETDYEVAQCLGIKKSSFSQAPKILNHAWVDRVRGAAVRLGVYRPDLFPEPNTKEVVTSEPTN